MESVLFLDVDQQQQNKPQRHQFGFETRYDRRVPYRRKLRPQHRAGFAFNSGGTLLHDYGGQYWTKSDLPSTLDSLSNGSKLKYGVQYLEIPIGLKMRTNEFGYIRYFLEPGISIGIKTQARGVINDPSQSGENEEKFNITKEVNGIYMSWGVGGGIEYSLSTSTSLIAGLGFQIGFTDVSDDNGTVFDPRGNRKEDAKAIINAITLKLGILF
ncbi:MAG: outer membrane beta-barrel protein [Saprospiraceae bacterium]|nr:outer membrane beta-barrel protein [Saprospiraceae bacterium]